MTNNHATDLKGFSLCIVLNPYSNNLHAIIKLSTSRRDINFYLLSLSVYMPLFDQRFIRGRTLIAAGDALISFPASYLN
jgi:hypothetical protein